MTMKPEIKALWIDALNSGEYKQATGTLRELDRVTGNVVGYCCLGVLTDLAEKAGVVKAKPREVDNQTCTYYIPANGPQDMWGENSGLSHEVREWAGLNSASGTFFDPITVEKTGYYGELITEEMNSLIALNDSGGYTFAQIAEVIDAKY